MLNKTFLISGVALAALSAPVWAHYDIAPYFQSGQLLTGGLDHTGTHYAPQISVYGYDFGEDPFDPYNPTDPGVNQQAGVGSLPAGSPLRYNILSSLTYWDGTGAVAWEAPETDTYIDLTMGSTTRTLTDSSGAQTGGLIQTVAAGGAVHKHFVTSLFDAPGASNIPGDFGYAAPEEGIYAFSIELTLTVSGITYESEPLWIIFNNGLDEETHDLAIESIPEPGSALVALLGAGALLARRRMK